MARVYPFTEERYARWCKEGRGTGIGDTWIPWVQRGDFNSSGIVTMESLVGDGGREIHVLSSIERLCWLTYASSIDVEGIEEQVPYDREISRRIAREMGIDHPRDPKSGVDVVITTDLVVRKLAPDGRVIRLARSVKPGHKLSNANQMEHAELERRLSAHAGHDGFAFLCEDSVPAVLAENVDRLYMHRDLHKQQEPLGYEGSFDYVCDEVMGRILSSKLDQTLAQFCLHLNDQMGWPSGLALRCALHLIRWHKLKADLVGAPLLKQLVSTLSSRSAGAWVRALRTRGA